jgi:hypothetical protein
VKVSVNPTGGGRIPGDPTVAVAPGANSGDVSVDEVFLSPSNEVIARIAVSPRGSVSGSALWKVVVNDEPVAENKISLPFASETFWSGYVVTGTQAIRVVVEIKDVNAANNEKKKTCYALTHICQ